MLRINCMFKSQIVSTDICSELEQRTELLLRLESADPKWPEMFLREDSADFRILHRGLSYPAHRAVIFKNMNLHVLDDEDSQGGLRAPDEIKPELLTGVLSYLYGLELRICRSDALQVLDVAHFLKISRLKRVLQEDILANFDEYELFPVLERARSMGLEEVEEACLRQLELEGFEQMRYAKFQLLSCSQGLFKEVVHRHNERRWDDPTFGLSEKFIQELIQEYCKHNNLNERKKSQLFKSFNQMSVRSEQPMNGVPGKTIVPPLKIKEGADISIKIYTPRPATTESYTLSPPTNYFKSRSDESTKSMIMDLTFMSSRKRRKSSRGSDPQTKTCADMIALKQSSIGNDKAIEELKDSLQKMDKILQEKETDICNNKYRLSQIERLLEECENDIMEDNRRARLLEVKVNKMAERRGKRENLEKQESQQEEEASSSSEEKDTSANSNNPKDENLSVSLIQSKWVCC